MSEIINRPPPELNKEEKETEPKITVDFFFSAHGSLADVDRLPALLKDADIFMTEGIGVAGKQEEILNRISNAQIKQPNPNEIHPFYFHIYDSKIPIVSIDIPGDHELTKRLLTAADAQTNAVQTFVEGDFDEAMEKNKKALTEMAFVQKLREAFITNKLRAELKQLTKKFPQLKMKKDIKVLVGLGLQHTSIHHDLKQELQLPVKTTSRDIIVFGTEIEIIKKLQANPQEAINDTLYARSLMEAFLMVVSNHITTDNVKLIHMARKLAANLSLDQIRSFCRTIFGTPPSEEVQSGKDARSYLMGELNKIGITIPSTEEEIDKFLNLRKK